MSHVVIDQNTSHVIIYGNWLGFTTTTSTKAKIQIPSSNKPIQARDGNWIHDFGYHVPSWNQANAVGITWGATDPGY